MEFPRTPKPHYSVRHSSKRLIVAGLAALVLPLGADVAHAQAGIDPLDFTELFDPLEGAILSHEYENVRVPEVPEKFCSQAEKDLLRDALLGAKEAAEENVDQALLTQQFLRTEIPGLEKGKRAAKKNADRAAKTGDPQKLKQALKQIDLYDQAIIRLHSSLGQAQAEEMHFGVTVERIDSNLEILEATKVTDCAQERLNSLGAARNAAPQFPGAKLNARFQPGFNLSFGAQYSDNAAKDVLDETMGTLVLPAPESFNRKDPLRVGVKPYQTGGAKWQLSSGAQYAANKTPGPQPAPAPQSAKPQPPVAAPDPNTINQNATPAQRTHTINLGFAQPYAGPPSGGQ